MLSILGGWRERYGACPFHLLKKKKPICTVYSVCENDRIIVEWFLFELKYFFSLYIYFIEVQLTYHVSGTQQVYSVIHIHIFFSGYFPL